MPFSNEIKSIFFVNPLKSLESFFFIVCFCSLASDVLRLLESSGLFRPLVRVDRKWWRNKGKLTTSSSSSIQVCRVLLGCHRVCFARDSTSTRSETMTAACFSLTAGKKTRGAARLANGIRQATRVLWRFTKTPPASFCFLTSKYQRKKNRSKQHRLALFEERWFLDEERHRQRKGLPFCNFCWVPVKWKRAYLTEYFFTCFFCDSTTGRARHTPVLSRGADRRYVASKVRSFYTESTYFYLALLSSLKFLTYFVELCPIHVILWGIFLWAPLMYALTQTSVFEVVFVFKRNYIIN